MKRVRPNVRGMTAIDAQLSPEGTMIAFVGSVYRAEQKRATFGVHILTLSGETSTIVTTQEATLPQSISWSSDGRRLVYDSDNQILVCRIDAARSTFLASGNNPTWSPGGSWIAYRRLDGTAALVRPDDGSSRRILDNVQLGRGMQWSPDGRYLLFTDFSNGGIRLLNIETGQTALVVWPSDHSTEARLRWVHGFLD